MMPSVLNAAPLPAIGRYAARPPRRKADPERMRLSAAIAATLDHLNHGIAVVDADLRVHHANRQLQGLCRRADGLLIRNGALAASEASGALQLHGALARALSSAADTTVRLWRLPPKRPLSILMRPLVIVEPSAPDSQPAEPPFAAPWQPAAGPQHATPLVLLLVGMPDRVAVPPATRLREAYRLTASEAAVAQRLLQGCDIHAVARLSNISITTARTHLRSLLAKTETHRQSELMWVLLQELGWMI